MESKKRSIYHKFLMGYYLFKCQVMASLCKIAKVFKVITIVLYPTLGREFNQ